MRVPGKEMQIGGVSYVLAPLNAAAFKTYREGINAAFRSDGIPDMEFVAKLVHASLLRNYPEMTEAQVMEMVDASNFVDLFEVVMNVSGLVASVGNMLRRVQEAMGTAPTSKS